MCWDNMPRRGNVAEEINHKYCAAGHSMKKKKIAKTEKQPRFGSAGGIKLTLQISEVLYFASDGG